MKSGTIVTESGAVTDSMYDTPFSSTSVMFTVPLKLYVKSGITFASAQSRVVRVVASTWSVKGSVEGIVRLRFVCPCQTLVPQLTLSWGSIGLHSDGDSEITDTVQAS